MYITKKNEFMKLNCKTFFVADNSTYKVESNHIIKIDQINNVKCCRGDYYINNVPYICYDLLIEFIEKDKPIIIKLPLTK